ncbi:hypothetical protein Tco_1424847 [Tanacetum coccineum]
MKYHPQPIFRCAQIWGCYSFKSQKEYRPVSKKLTASSSGNKKKGVEPTIEVSNSNPFDVLNSVDNDVDYGTTPIIDKIVKFEDLHTSRQAILVDKDGNSLKKVDLLEQWRDSYGNGDYDDDPYDNDMYEGQDLSQDLQAL